MSLRVLIFCDDPDGGGTAVCTHRLALGLARRGFTVAYAQPQGNEERLEERNRAGIRSFPIPYDTMKHFCLSMQDRTTAIEIYRRWRPDLVLFADSIQDSTLAAKEAAYGLGIPFLAVKHMVLPEIPWGISSLTRTDVRRVNGLAQRVVTVSEASRTLFCDQFGVDPCHVTVIPNGRPAAFFAPRSPETRETLRREWGVPDDALVVLTVGTFSTLKGFDIAVRAVGETVRRGIEGVCFVWVGGGTEEYEASLRSGLAAAGASDRVRFIPRRDDIARCLDAADVYLLPSMFENCPLVLLEAMAKGIPVIATAVGGIPETLKDCGVLATSPLTDEGRTVADMVDALADWRAEPARAAAFGAMGTRRAASRFTEDAFLDRYAALIREAAFPADDYVAPGLDVIKPDHVFPSLVRLDRERVWGAGSRKDFRHNQYADGYDTLRLLPNRDEAHILYNLARRFAGRRGLLIGGEIGWTARHLAEGGVKLDILDLHLGDPERLGRLKAGLDGLSDLRLFSGWGAEAVGTLVAHHTQKGEEPWSLAVFNLAEREPDIVPAIRRCAAAAAPDAMIVVWNALVCQVEDALQRLKAEGWSIRLYDTVQMIAVAWRGATGPVDHRPDPRARWLRPQTLAPFS